MHLRHYLFIAFLFFYRVLCTWDKRIMGITAHWLCTILLLGSLSITTSIFNIFPLLFFEWVLKILGVYIFTSNTALAKPSSQNSHHAFEISNVSGYNLMSHKHIKRTKNTRLYFMRCCCSGSWLNTNPVTPGHKGL